jgi:hypothetical protein
MIFRETTSSTSRKRVFPAVQLLWPNTSGVYPWNSGADDYLRWVQPVLSSLPLRALT